MKKLEKIDFQKCDVLSQDQLNALKGGAECESTHRSVCNSGTNLCGESDISYKITWDSGAVSYGLITEEVDPE